MGMSYTVDCPFVHVLYYVVIFHTFICFRCFFVQAKCQDKNIDIACPGNCSTCDPSSNREASIDGQTTFDTPASFQTLPGYKDNVTPDSKEQVTTNYDTDTISHGRHHSTTIEGVNTETTRQQSTTNKQHLNGRRLQETTISSIIVDNLTTGQPTTISSLEERIYNMIGINITRTRKHLPGHHVLQPSEPTTNATLTNITNKPCKSGICIPDMTIKDNSATSDTTIKIKPTTPNVKITANSATTDTTVKASSGSPDTTIKVPTTNLTDKQCIGGLCIPATTTKFTNEINKNAIDDNCNTSNCSLRNIINCSTKNCSDTTPAFHSKASTLLSILTRTTKQPITPTTPLTLTKLLTPARYHRKTTTADPVNQPVTAHTEVDFLLFCVNVDSKTCPKTLDPLCGTDNTFYLNM